MGTPEQVRWWAEVVQGHVGVTLEGQYTLLACVRVYLLILTRLPTTHTHSLANRRVHGVRG
jgi:hypothetical protein